MYKIAKPIDFDKPALVSKLSRLMHEFMIADNGIGLAAPQVGIGRRIFVMKIYGQEYTCCNPEITDSSKEHIVMREGCLSFPNDVTVISRPCWIKIKYQDVQGNVIEQQLDGLAARCFQHELDHLNGITMHDRQEQQL